MVSHTAPIGERILPYTHVLIRLPSGAPRVIKIIPDTAISLGKFGSFPANALIHRPYNLTFDILDAPATGLRVVSAAEVTRDILGGDAEAEQGHYELECEDGDGEGGGDGDGEGEGEGVMRTNRDTVDDPLAQKMSWVEIEELKKQGTGSGRDLVQKLLSSHSALHQKTPFALQKYTLRKTKKFLRRFTVLPLSVQSLTNFLLEAKEPVKILDLRDETLGLMLSLANVHWGGRWLVVDETGGLLVAAVAERLGLLEYAPDGEEAFDEDVISLLEGKRDEAQPKRRRHEVPCLPTRNTITLIHPNEQPNLSLLKYFNYDTNSPTPSHPLHTHVRTLNWLQLVAPESDTTLQKPQEIPADVLLGMKGGKRAAYWRKMRRWERITHIVADTHKGNFDGLLVAGFMELKGVMRYAVPLLKGSAQVAVYSPNREAVTEVADLYSSARKAEWIARSEFTEGVVGEDGEEVDPTLLLAPTVHESRARRYQVLPGRTHPVMTSRGGGEGCVLSGTRVLPVEGRVEARGVFRGAKRRKSEGGGENGDGCESPLKKMKEEQCGASVGGEA